MTTANTKKPEEMTRDKIDAQLKWNLADIYPTDNDWEKDLEKAKTMIAGAKKFIGKLNDSPEILSECFTARSELGKTIFNLFQYAHLNKDLDNRDSKNQAMNDRAAMITAQSGAAFSFVEPELLKMTDEQLIEISSKIKNVNEYDLYFKELIRSRKHIRSEEVEELLAQSAIIARAPDTIFTALDDADLIYPSVTDEDGNEIKLTKQKFMKLMESSNAKLRKDANEAFYQPYKEHINTTGAALSSSVTKDIFYAKARKFDSCLHASLDGDNISLDVYHSLLDNTESDLSGLHKYVALRKKILKLDKIHGYDMFCPLFPDKDYEVPYTSAIDEIMIAVKPLGKDYLDSLKHAFDSRWVDVYETPGKSSGAFSWGNFCSHPFVLMNYNGTVDNMFTLVHEMGHAMHSHFSNNTQPYTKSQYSIFVAEVASTLNEGLLLNHLLSKATDTQEKLYLLNRHIDNTVGTFFNQILYARFELLIHDEIEKGGALAPDNLTDLWKQLTQQYYGPDFTVDEKSILKWSRIPHFYRAYYVYQYATSYAASQAILSKFMDGDKTIIEKYLKLISSGGSDYPIELLKLCDVDMTTPDPVKATLNLFGKQVDELMKLV